MCLKSVTMMKSMTPSPSNRLHICHVGTYIIKNIIKFFESEITQYVLSSSMSAILLHWRTIRILLDIFDLFQEFVKMFFIKIQLFLLFVASVFEKGGKTSFFHFGWTAYWHVVEDFLFWDKWGVGVFKVVDHWDWPVYIFQYWMLLYFLQCNPIFRIRHKYFIQQIPQRIIHKRRIRRLTHNHLFIYGFRVLRKEWCLTRHNLCKQDTKTPNIYFYAIRYVL